MSSNVSMGTGVRSKIEEIEFYGTYCPKQRYEELHHGGNRENLPLCF